jgi:hypothetical protein
MSVLTATITNWHGPSLPVISSPRLTQSDRIQRALGVTADGLPSVAADTLARYYAYLAANLALPFTAYYPEPMTAAEKDQFCCVVLEVLDPAQHRGDEFDGILCRIRKGNCDVNLPLTELHVPNDGADSQLLADYSYWFWNWR